MSLTAWCQYCRPQLFLLDRPWWPFDSTSVPHIQVWGDTMWTLRWRPTEICISWSDKWRPILDDGSTWIHKPQATSPLARIRALSEPFEASRRCCMRKLISRFGMMQTAFIPNREINLHARWIGFKISNSTLVELDELNRSVELDYREMNILGCLGDRLCSLRRSHRNGSKYFSYLTNGLNRKKPRIPKVPDR